jgi:hypothetical protein
VKGRLKGISLPDQQGEVVVSKDNNRVAIHRAARAGKLRKLAPRVYTTNLQDPPDKIVRANCWTIAGALFPHALISDRTALEQRPAVDGSVFLVTDSRSTDLELPGITFRPRRGHPPVEGYDMPFLAGLWMSSQARALMDNLRSTRQRGHVRGTLTREELEEFIEKILRNSGKPVLNKLRDQAREIAPPAWYGSRSREVVRNNWGNDGNSSGAVGNGSRCVAFKGRWLRPRPPDSLRASEGRSGFTPVCGSIGKRARYLSAFLRELFLELH